jgi:hypothetical protein
MPQVFCCVGFLVEAAIVVGNCSRVPAPRSIADVGHSPPDDKIALSDLRSGNVGGDNRTGVVLPQQFDEICEIYWSGTHK